MTRLDRYTLFRFLSSLALALGAFIIIFLVIDLVENIDKFLDTDVPPNIVAQYYLHYIPYIIVLILPVTMLLASIFSLSRMSKDNEITAMKSAGVSLYRIVVPVLVSSFLIFLCSILFGESIVPSSNEKRLNLKRVWVEKKKLEGPRYRNNLRIQLPDKRFLLIDSWDRQRMIAENVVILERTSSVLSRRMDIRSMKWIDSTRAWVLTTVEVREFVSDHESYQVIRNWTRNDLRIRPEELNQKDKNPEEMNYYELEDFIAELEVFGLNPQKWIVALHHKLAFPFTNFVVVLFGIPVSSRKRRSGVAFGIGVSLAICFLYYGLITIGETLGKNGTMDPALSAWLGNLVFFSVGLILMNRTE